LSYLTSNLSLLARRQPELARILNEIEYTRVKVFDSVRGGPTAIYKRDTSEISLHSRYEPKREAQLTLKKVDCSGSDYFIFLGFGLGYLLDALIETGSDPSCHYFIVESDLEILKAALEARNFSSMLTLPNIHFAWPANGPELADQWMEFFDPVHAQGSTFLTHLPSMSLDPELYKSAARIIQSQTFQIFTDINTLVEKSETFLDNFVQNIGKAALAPGVVRFAGKFSNTPAVIVSAGPSLDKNIHELRGWEDQVLILSTDTALKPLLAAGIEPHFLLTGDPFYVNYRHMEGAKVEKCLIVAESTSYPEVFNQFENRIVTCTYDNSSLRSLSDLIGNKGILRAWGSVATMALDFALVLECNPVIFIGQDLAHTSGRIYCSGICFEKEWYDGITDPEMLHQKNLDMRASRRTVMSEDIFGCPIESTDKLTAYWNWILKEIRKNPSVHFVNATEGGILQGGVEIISLKHALHRYCTDSLNLHKKIQKIFMDSHEAGFHSSGLEISTFISETHSIKKLLSRGLNLCRSKSKHSASDLRKRLDDVKEGIYFNSHIAPFLDCLNQMGNVAFLRRCRGLKNASPDNIQIPEIQDIFGEYFDTVLKALDKVEKALKQIRINLGHP
jgi:hypothetical protein